MAIEEPYRITEAPGKGLGVYATSDIMPGATILSETPLLHLRYPPSRVVKSSTYFKAEFKRLRGPDRTAFLQLSSDSDDRLFAAIAKCADRFTSDVDTGTALAIWETNRFDVTPPATEGQEGKPLTEEAIFNHISRFNHSCAPNAQYRWDHRAPRMSVYAIKPIVKGEEITVSYIQCCTSRRYRQKRLSVWGFRCQCIACDNSTNSGRQHVRNRDRIAEIIDNVDNWIVELQDEALNEKEVVRVKNDLEEAVRLSVEEGFVHSKLRKVYLCLAKAHQQLGNITEARIAAEDALNLSELWYGSLAYQTRELRALVAELKIASWKEYEEAWLS